MSTPGGWLRVFGRSIGTPAAGHARAAVATLEAAIQAAIRTKDFPRAQLLMSNLEQATASVDAAAGTTLRLKPEGSGAPITLQAVAANTTEYHASFLVPASLPAGKYTAQISNGRSSHAKGEWVNLKMFAPAHAPSVLEKNGVDGDGIVRVVTVEAPRVWKDDVFTVDCEWTKPIFERPCGWVGARSSVQVDAALAKAKANGGGVVMLPRGQYYVDGPLIVPEGTRLVGEGEQLVSIFFREDNPDTAPKPGYIHANNSAAAWAVEDLSVYVTHYYYSVFYVEPTCKDWTLRNVRVRAVAWAMISDPVLGNNGRGGRLANFSRGQVGEVIYLDGNNNYKIEHNDLLATGIVIHTGGARPLRNSRQSKLRDLSRRCVRVRAGHGFNNGGSAKNGIVAHNKLYNANAAHWFDDIKQVIPPVPSFFTRFRPYLAHLYPFFSVVCAGHLRAQHDRAGRRRAQLGQQHR